MGKRVIRLRSIIWVAVLTLSMAMIWACKMDEKGNNTMVSDKNSPRESMSNADESLLLAKKIQGLKELPLPDEWYSAEGTTFRQRLENASKAMRSADPGAPSAGELMARYENGGLPAVHHVWLNQPLYCEKCNQAGADGFLTVFSIAKGLAVTVSAGQMHEVLNHQGKFPEDVFRSLKRIFASD